MDKLDAFLTGFFVGLIIYCGITSLFSMLG